MKKSTKWMRFSMLWIAVAALMVVIAVLACGPASPAQQAGGSGDAESVSVRATETPFVPQQSGDGEKEKLTATSPPTATPYPDDCMEFQNPDSGEMEMVCPEPGPRAIEQDLRKQYNRHMATKEAETQDGRRSTVDPVTVDVVVSTSTEDAVDAVVAFLQENGANVFGQEKGGVHAAGYVHTMVDIELLPRIVAIEGVHGVWEVDVGAPQGGNPQGTPVRPMTALQRTNADQWHRAGITGDGVEVGVVDADFASFRTRVLPLLSYPVRFFCYDSMGVVHQGELPLPSTDPAAEPDPGFSACETSDGMAGAHGTDVVRALVDTAPGIKLSITNGIDRVRLVQSVDWLTAKRSDNSRSDTDYDRESNDEFDVKIINFSRKHVWDGRGDGTSGFDDSLDRSPIKVAEDAVGRGVLWVTGAGNEAQGTWFDDDLSFDDNRLEFPVVGSEAAGCIEVTLAGGTKYVFQKRWNGDWPEDGSDDDVFLGMALRGPIEAEGDSGDVVAMGSQLPRMRGEAYPWRRMTYLVPADGTGRYCIHVAKNQRSEEPAWSQVQLFDPSGASIEPRSPMGEGSVVSPAEGVKPGILTVGAMSNAATPMQLDHSSRGPLPESTEVKPETYGVVTGTVSHIGTSLASARVAALAALRAQGLGYTTPAAAARSLTVSSETGGGPTIVVLPNLAPPTNVSVTHHPCLTKYNLRVSYDHPSIGVSGVFPRLKAVQIGPDGSEVDIYETELGSRSSSLSTMTDRGSYDVTVRMCTVGGFCSPPSSPPVRLTTEPEVCTPKSVRAIAGDGQITLRWNP